MRNLGKNILETFDKVHLINRQDSLGPDGMDRRVGHALEEALEKPDADEEPCAHVGGERRDHGEAGGGGDAREEDPLAAVLVFFNILKYVIKYVFLLLFNID